MPALLTKTSICLNADCACCTAAFTSPGFVTSSLMATAVSGYCATMSFTSLILRDVTAALYPNSNTCLASSRPKPVEQPVINHTLLIVVLFIKCIQEYIAFIIGRNQNKKQSAIKTRKKKNCFLAGKFILIGNYSEKALVYECFGRKS